jgi:hypothetical protein
LSVGDGEAGGDDCGVAGAAGWDVGADEDAAVGEIDPRFTARSIRSLGSASKVESGSCPS